MIRHSHGAIDISAAGGSFTIDFPSGSDCEWEVKNVYLKFRSKATGVAKNYTGTVTAIFNDPTLPAEYHMTFFTMANPNVPDVILFNGCAVSGYQGAWFEGPRLLRENNGLRSSAITINTTTLADTMVYYTVFCTVTA